MAYDNEYQLLQDLKDFGITLRRQDDPIGWVDKGRRTCGKGGKFWVNLRSFSPQGTNRHFIVGAYGSYRDKQTCKVEWDRESLTEELREQYKREREAAREREQREAAEAVANAALSARELWRTFAREGQCEYLARKRVQPEACRYVSSWLRIARRDPVEKPFVIPPGSIVLPLIRYDLARDEALRGLQFLKPDGFKLFTEGFGKTGCAVRLGDVDELTRLVLVCEGYATGLSIRMAIDRQAPVYVALDAYNLEAVVSIVRALHPDARILICADDDWKTADHHGPNPGRHRAKAAAKATPNCDIVWPVFARAARQPKDTDFNDLHAREGLQVVSAQLQAVMRAIERGLHHRGR